VQHRQLSGWIGRAGSIRRLIRHIGRTKRCGERADALVERDVGPIAPGDTT